MNKELIQLLKSQSMDEVYLLVKWPDVQELMDHDWFRAECLLHNAFEDQEYLDSAYFVPLSRMLEVWEKE